MEEKQTYMPRNIYFGRMTFNAKSEGYYVTGIEAFEKFINDSEEVMYRKVKQPTKAYKKHTKNTEEYLTVSELFPITGLMSEEKHDKPMSMKMINLYLLKYQIKETLKRKPKEEIKFYQR